MNSYFFFSGKDTRGSVASAFAPREVKLAQDLILDLEGINELPFELNLVKLSVSNNKLIKSDNLADLKEIWLDYQPNSLAWPLLSGNLQITINKCLTGNEGIDWITVKVNGNREQRIYYVPRFKEMLDVLDIQKTMFVEGTDVIIRPVFAITKIKAFSIFSKPSSYDFWKITSGLYINEALKKAIQKEKLTGVCFEKVTVSLP